MVILGINFGHDAACTLIRAGRVIASIEEEKTSRIKQDFGWPATAVDRLLKEYNLLPSEVNIVAFGSNFYSSINRNEIRYRFNKNKTSKFFEIADRIAAYSGFRYIEKRGKNRAVFQEELRKAGFVNAEVKFYNHHLSHAASAWYAAPYQCDLIFTADGHGDGESITFYEPDPEKGLKLIKSYGHEVSVGQFYSEITRLLGFRPTRHEGKITGLAAYGKPGPLLDKFRGLFQLNDLDLSRFPYGKEAESWQQYNLDETVNLKKRINFFSESDFGSHYAKNALILNAWLDEETKGHTKENIAYACQKVTEEVVYGLLDAAIREKFAGKSLKVGLAGGVFANVRVNQLLFEHPAVEGVFIQPAMGDSGLALGAAILADIETHGNWLTDQYRFKDTYLGPDYSSELQDFVKEIDRSKYEVSNLGEEAPKRIAELLRDNVIVGFWQGSMEWGPRALGKRSMILNTFDRTVNDTLNKRLNRTEFMPFAPSVVDYMAKTYMPAYKEEDVAADYMTITYDVDPRFHNLLQAVVHVDGTARPQVVKKATNPYFYDIIDAFYRLTGCGAVVNTSFNVHEEPIVSTPNSAFRALEDKRIDALLLNTYLITIKK